jgi:hypothetical protein
VTVPNPTTFSSQKQFIGVAKETTQGTAIQPTHTMLVEKFEPEDQITWLDDTSLRGSMPELYGRVLGPQKVEWSLSGNWYPDTFGFLANNILGDIATTGASAPYAHAMSTLNTGTSQPGSLTITDYQGTPATYPARTYAGCCLSELTIKGNAESSLIQVEAKGIGWGPSAIAGATPTSSPSTEVAFAAWRTALGIAGAASGGTQVKTVGEWEVAIKRDLQPIYTAQNSSSPYWIHRGKIGVSGKLKFVVAADETPLTYMLNNTQPRVELTFNNALASSASGYRAMTMNMTNAAFKTSKIDRGSSAVGYETEFDAIANTTDAGASAGYSPIKITLNNAIAASTY